MRSNVDELRVASYLERTGWEVLSRGWPDFVAVKGDQVRFIEVKPNKNQRGLSPAQRRIAEILKRYGISVECFRPRDCDKQTAR
jgi:Holliday junction resolvase-like predicted endonuclease